MAKYIKLTVFVPLTHSDRVREAMGKAGAGKIGDYSHCTFSTLGIGRSISLEEANQASGSVGELEAIEEEKIETFCEEFLLEKVIHAIKAVHPYEELSIAIYPIEMV